jgi:hypothetical protein
MTLDDLIARYPALSAAEQISFLSHLAANLTVFARGTYEVQTVNVADPPRLRGFNEFQHRVSFHLSHMIDGHNDRYPDDVLARMIAEYARELGCEQAVANVFERSCRSTAVPISAV